MFDTYRDKYENVRMRREDGILEVALHSGDGPLVPNVLHQHNGFFNPYFLYFARELVLGTLE